MNKCDIGHNMKNLSYIPSTKVVANDVEEQNTATLVWEKLSVTGIFLWQRRFALYSTE